MNRHFYVILLIVASTAFEGCWLFPSEEKPKTELDKLPPPTTTGKFTFGCLVNGKAYVTESTVDVSAFYQQNVFQISADFKKSIYGGLSIGLTGVTLEQGVEFVLGDYGEQYGIFSDFIEDCIYDTSLPNYTGLIKITFLNKDKYIISGTFEFVAYSNDCEKVVEITEGRFDIKYTP